MLPPPMTMPICAPVFAAFATKSAVFWIAATSTPSPPGVQSDSPESLSITRRYGPRPGGRGSLSVADIGSLPDLEAREALDLERRQADLVRARRQEGGDGLV